MTREERLRTLFRPRNLQGPAKKVTIICAECGAEKERYLSTLIDKDTKMRSKRTYCSKLCQSLGWTKYLTDEERKAAARKKQRDKYQSDKEWAARRRKEGLARMNAKQKDPEFRKHKAEVAHARYMRRRAELMKDPKKMEAHRKHMNKIAKKSRETMKKKRGPRPITDAVRARKLAWWHANKHRYNKAPLSHKRELSPGR